VKKGAVPYFQIPNSRFDAFLRSRQNLDAAIRIVGRAAIDLLIRRRKKTSKKIIVFFVD
jgi:hypothetical protein